MSTRVRSKRLERELQRETESWAIVLDEDRADMEQAKLGLKDPPIRGASSQVSAGDGGTDSHTAAPTSSTNQIPDAELSKSHTGEVSVAATPAVQQGPKPLTESREKELSRQFADEAGRLQEKAASLYEKRKKASGQISPFLLAEAQELKEQAAVYRDALAKSEWRQDATVFHRWHTRLTGLLNAFAKPADDADKLFNDFAYSRKQQIEAAARAERKRFEDAQRKKDEEERAAAAAALKAEGRVEEAKIVQETPLPPPAAPPAKEAVALPGGISARGIPKLVRIKDYAKFVDKVLVRSPDRLLDLFEPRAGRFTSWLSSHMDQKTGEMTLDLESFGIEIEIKGSARSGRTQTGNDDEGR